MNKVVLISNRVMHYRVSVYNYFAQAFRQHGWELIVRSNELQKENPHPLEFDFKEIDLTFCACRDEIRSIGPKAVILFLHLKDPVLWPLIHWLPMKGIPLIYWTKGANLDDADSRLKYLLFNYVHSRCDRLILYSPHETKYLTRANRRKVYVANNTINFADFPAIADSREAIKREFKVPFDKVVLSVGRMDVGRQRKKVDHLIEVFRRVRVPGAGLVIVGAGVSRELQARMNRENTIYLGEIYDARNIQISKIFRMADLFSIPGHVGLGLVQAFHFGLPVVTEEGLQPPEIHYLRDGWNGYLVPENDIDALQMRIEHLLRNDEERRTFSRNARQGIEEHGSIDTMFLGFKNCLESLVPSAGAAAGQEIAASSRPLRS
jgi:glycosyltransferase involved in cell wall biosynthesis